MFHRVHSSLRAWMIIAFLFWLEPVKGSSLRQTFQQLRPDEGKPELNSRTAPILKSQEAKLTAQGATSFVAVPLINNKNIQYYGKVGVGSSAQLFDVLFDTGSGDSWIPGVKCKYYPKKHDQPREIFYANQSSTFQDDGSPFVVHYGTGSVKGRWFSDDVHIAGTVVKGQELVQADMLGLGTQNTFFDGTFGLGFSMNNKPTIYESMFAQNLIEEPIYSIYLKRTANVDPQLEVFGGELLFGAVDWEKIEGDQIYYSDVVGAERWQIKIDGISAKKPSNNFTANDDVKDFCSGGCRTIIDSGSSFIVGPSEEVARLNQLLGGVKSQKSAEYIIPDCNIENLPDLVFTIEGLEFPLKPEHYLARVGAGDGSVTCFTGIMGLPFLFGDEEPLWIVGTAFMAQYYTVFDFGQNKIGFAPLKDSSLIP